VLHPADSPAGSRLRSSCWELLRLLPMLVTVTAALDYSSPGPLTGLDGIDPEVLADLPDDPVAICAPVQNLVIQPGEAKALGLGPERLSTNQVRPAAKLIEALLALNPSPLTTPRRPEERVVGTCRHFAVISCALLRYRGVPARVRCGFATYFQAGQGLDHWITEYRHGNLARWVRIDSEVLGGQVLAKADDLQPGEFLSGGEAWSAFRRGVIDADTFGVCGSENWGPAEIRGNAVKDLAALNRVETLPWDEWGRMTAAYKGETGADYDELLDTVAAVCAEDEPGSLAALYGHVDLRVPDDLVR
jgi:hypothetical protein